MHLWDTGIPNFEEFTKTNNSIQKDLSLEFPEQAQNLYFYINIKQSSLVKRHLTKCKRIIKQMFFFHEKVLFFYLHVGEEH